MRLLRFTQNWNIYAAGETAAFDDQESARLIAAGVAKPAEPLLERAAAALGLKKKPDASATKSEAD